MSNGTDQQGERLSEGDSVRVSEEVALAVASGLALSPGLRATAQELSPGHKKIRRALTDVADRLDQGVTIDEALRTVGARIPAHLRGLVEVSARGGRPALALGNYVNFSSIGSDLRWKLWASLLYPTVCLTLAAGLFVFICVALVGNFEGMYRDFGVPLPRLTIVLMMVARPFYNAWDVLIEGFIGLVFFTGIFLFFVDQGTRRGLVSSIPVVGIIFRNISMAEFCHLLALLLESEVPLPGAVRMAGSAVSDSRLERAADGVSQDLSGGMPLADAVSRRSAFPAGLSRVLRWAEKSRSLPESLHMVAEMFASSARAQAEFAGSFLSILAVLAIIFGSAVFAVGLLFPMIQLISALAG